MPSPHPTAAAGLNVIFQSLKQTAVRVTVCDIFDDTDGQTSAALHLSPRARFTINAIHLNVDQ